MTTSRVADKPANQSCDRNPDPITNEAGAHPVGVGVGAAVTGALAGAAAGALGGPIGAAVGVVAGAVAGELGGKAVAESIDPTVEDQYWREAYPRRPYYSAQTKDDEYAPAYRYGWENRTRYQDRQFDDVEPELSTQWEKSRSTSRLSWEKAKLAVRDARDRTTGL